MKLSIHPSGQPGGLALAIPPGLSRHLVPWARPLYQEYDFGSVLVQEYETARYGFYSWRVRANRPVTLYLICEKPTLALQFMLQGNISCVLSGYGRKELFEHHYEFFYVPAGVQEAAFQEGEYHTLHIELDDTFLREGIQVYPDLERLVARVSENSAEGDFVGPFSLDYKTAYIVHRLLTEPGTEGLSIKLQKYIFDLLYEYLPCLERLRDRLAARVLLYARAMEKLQEHIRLAPNINDYTIAKLARWSAMSATQLKASFREIVGVPLATYVRQQALEKAHWMLLQTNRSIEDIADEVGYSNVTNLNQAFRAQFGYLPGSLRKRSGKKE